MEKREYSTIYRIMHWSIAISMLLLLVTIFLRLTWMNKDNMADIIQNYLADNQLDLSRDQIIVLAKQIRKPMWDWHIYLGYILTGLYVIRMSLPFFGQMRFVSPLKRQTSFKEKIQFWAYIVFYACVAVSLITGLIIKHGPKNLKETMEEVHELSIYYLVAFLLVHLTGVLIAEFTDQKGIVSKIVSGSDQRNS
jgi:cytochrome b561